MMIGLVLVLSLLAEPQRPPQGPPPPPPDIAAIAQYAARLTVLEQRKQELEAELFQARRQFGESHPQVVILRDQLAEADKALQGEGTAWREAELDKLVERRVRLERDLFTAQTRYGLRHPTILSLKSDIDAISARLKERADALLATGLEVELVAETARKDTNNLAAFLRLAKLYAAAGRPADAERVLTDAITVLRARGK